MADKTANYGLTKPLPSEFYDVTVQNGNMDAIDAALHGLETGKETPEGAQEKADQAKAEAISACRPADWIPNSEEIGPAIKEVIEGQKGKANGLASLGSSGTIPSAQIPTLTSTKLPTVPVSKGGTGKTFWQANRLIYPASSAAFSQLPYPTEAESVLCQDPSDEPYWMKKGDLLSETASNSDHQLKTYTDLSQIGLTVGSETIESICEALPDASMLVYAVGSTNNGSIYPKYLPNQATQYGLMEVIRREITRVVMHYVPKVETETQMPVEYIGMAYQDSGVWHWSGWTADAPSVNGFTFAVSDTEPSNAPAGRITFVYEA